MISAEGIDLTYEGIATLFGLYKIFEFEFAEGIDLTYEGIATHSGHRNQSGYILKELT